MGQEDHGLLLLRIQNRILPIPLLHLCDQDLQMWLHDLKSVGTLCFIFFVRGDSVAVFVVVFSRTRFQCLLLVGCLFFCLSVFILM